MVHNFPFYELGQGKWSGDPLDSQWREAYRILVGGVNAPGEYRHEGDRALRMVCMPGLYREA